MFLLLPPALVALILASPALAVPTSSNDPFKALAAQVVKPPEPPICCLVPLPPTEFSEEDVLLSFEEWKEKAKAQHAPAAADAADTSSTVALEAPSVPVDTAPHFRVPITDRFNYASLDCSARVHTSHRSAKSPASILSSKRDKYMLSPCRGGDEQFVVVELCDDIRIDTVQLANFEFFSGVFKDFTVSVSKTYTTDSADWIFASRHTAKNIRVVQSFHPPTSLSDFYRYIRIDFHSHYGNEYYCPVSLLRVYGLTHLEEYKWDLWQTESRARAQVEVPPLEVHEPVPEPEPVHIPASYVEYVEKHAILTSEFSSHSTVTETQVQDTVEVVVETPDSTQIGSAPNPPAPVQSQSAEEGQSTTSAAPVPEQTSEPSLVSVEQQQQQQQPHVPNAAPSSPDESGADPSASTSTSAAAAADESTASPSVSSTSEPILIHRPSTSGGGGSETTVVSAGGESIYRTIMNRLAALEANHTLYARYVEEHAGAVREVLRRVGEDLGRAEGVGKAQAQMHARALRDWERERRRGEGEYAELVRRMEYLSSEIVLEKRLGIAQLLLLVTVLVFMTLTRGSRGEVATAMVPSMRAWGRRHLSMSMGNGDWDWVGRLKSRSRSRAPGPKQPANNENENDTKPPANLAEPKPVSTPVKHEFPTVEDAKPAESNGGFSAPTSARKQRPRPLSLHPPRTSTPMHSHSHSHPRTPLRRPLTPTPARSNTPLHQDSRRPLPPTPAPAPMQHSMSSDAQHAPRSAKRWARTAHLHELRSPRVRPGTPRQGAGLGAAGAGDMDVFASLVSDFGRVGGGSEALVMPEGEVDAWIDTDLEGSEADVDIVAGGRGVAMELPESPSLVRRVDVRG